MLIGQSSVMEIKKKYTKLLLSFFLFINLNGFSQFTIIGNSYPIPINSACSLSDTCFTLTDNTGQAGAVWHESRFDMSLPFDGIFCLYLGDADVSATCYDDDEDNGADGFAFVLKDTNAASLGSTGGGVGFAGISPSVAIEFDTYPNPGNGDVGNVDHTALYFNGDQSNTIEGPFPLLSGGVNAEDGDYHYARLVWDPVTFELLMYFDGELKFAHTQDLINDVFGGKSIVDWGFTASTGACFNVQQICFPAVGVELDPIAYICEFDTVEISYFENNLTDYNWIGPNSDTLIHWNINDGVSLVDTTLFISQSGVYHLNVVQNNILAQDSIEVVVAPYPVFNYPDSIEFCPRDNFLTLSAEENVGASFFWEPSQSTGSSVIVDTTQNVVVTISEPINNCTITDSVAVEAYCDPLVLLPNTFTPNQDPDNKNELFLPVEWSWVGDHNLAVYNRWGELMYQVENENSWDGRTMSGKKVPEGVYYYLFDYTDLREGDPTYLSGTVTLFR